MAMAKSMSSTTRQAKNMSTRGKKKKKLELGSDSEDDQVFDCGAGAGAKQAPGLCLSEESSSDGSDDFTPPKSAKRASSKLKKTPAAAARAKCHRSPAPRKAARSDKKNIRIDEAAKSNAESSLEALAVAASQSETVSTKQASSSSQPPPPVKTILRHKDGAEKAFDQEIRALLAKEDGNDGQDSFSDDDDAEEDDMDEVVSQSIEIKLALPEKGRKRGKKAFDVEAYIKRRIAKARREEQVTTTAAFRSADQSRFQFLPPHRSPSIASTSSASSATSATSTGSSPAPLCSGSPSPSCPARTRSKGTS